MQDVRLWLPMAANFGTTQYDFSGSANDSIASNTVWTNAYGGGLPFNGTTSRIIRSNIAGLSATNNATWIFVFRLNSYGGGGAGRLAGVYDNTAAGYFINAFTNNSRFYNGQAGQSVTTPYNTVPTNQIVRLTWTRNGTAVVGYTGGVRVVSGSIGANIIALSSPLAIGCNYADTTRTIDGTMYLFSYCGRALSSNEVWTVDQSIKGAYP